MSVHGGGFPVCTTGHMTSIEGVCLGGFASRGDASKGLWQIPSATGTRKVGGTDPNGMLSYFYKILVFCPKNKTKQKDNSPCDFHHVNLISLIRLEQINRTVCRQTISKIENTLQRKVVNGFAAIFGTQTVQAVEKLL